MDSVKIDITGDRQVGLRFDQFPDVLYDDLRVEVDSLSTELFALIEAATPSRLGTLRGQERLRLFTDKTRITGYVDVAGAPGSQDFAKAGALEYGTRGKSNKVVSHSMRLDHFWADKLKDPITVVTKAFDRTPNIEEHAFERGPLEAMAPQILSRLNAVVAAAVAEANK